MTWNANRIYVNASPAVLEKLRGERVLAGHVFLLKGTLPSSWEATAAEVQLPKEGLLCIKEIGPTDEDDMPGDAQADSPEVETGKHHSWYSPKEWLPWTAIQGPPECAVIDYFDGEDFNRPPAGFLRFLRGLREAGGTPVTYYLCQMWGGDVEHEVAWVFGENDVVYRYRAPGETLMTDASGQRPVHEDVLSLALDHHGIRMPSAYFAPHTRGFDWPGHLLSL